MWLVFELRTLWSIRSKALRKSSRTTLAVAPFPSVLTSQLCVMLTKACVVNDLGIVPNCRGSILCNTAGLTYLSTMWSSASLDKIGVREMGRRCLLISLMGLCLGTGNTLYQRPVFVQIRRWLFVPFVSFSLLSIPCKILLFIGPRKKKCFADFF